jgi:hypothetical protein
MSDLDVAKEEIAYLKVWLGILVVTDISPSGGSFPMSEKLLHFCYGRLLSLWQA